MKKYFSVLVVLISLIFLSNNFVFAGDTQNPANNVSETASVYWNFVILDQITTSGESAIGNYNLVAGTTIQPLNGGSGNVGGNTIEVGFTGTDGYHTQWTVVGSNSTNYNSYINSSTGTSVTLGNGATINFTIDADTQFGNTDSGWAYFDVIIGSISSDANNHGSDSFSWTITCEYSL